MRAAASEHPARGRQPEPGTLADMADLTSKVNALMPGLVATLATAIGVVFLL